MVDESPTLLRVEKHVTDYLSQNDHVGYNRFTDFPWATLKDSLTDSGLKEMHIGAVETAMLVEDHIPGYGSEYTRIFMVSQDRTDSEAWKCRQMLHFVFRWIAEEDRHGHLLELWLRHSGRRDEEALTNLMVTECKKKYEAPHDNPTQLFTYTSVQEKATQLFYSTLRQSVDEPVLRDILARLSQDEARHCNFFSQLCLDALAEANTRHVSQIKEALQHFSMPLAMMMDNYLRKAIQMKRAARGYDYMEALEHFARLVQKTIQARTNSRSAPLQDLLQFTMTKIPHRKLSPETASQTP
ncbi:MAG: acyl-ACP desaturase [Armatimonadetes bacterium]|nr:acyl-ACP desaturase [Armatimonadota bacterium]